MKQFPKLIVVFLALWSNLGSAQELTASPEKYTAHNKGKFYVYWGGNRGYFTDSDIRFRGDNYDFTLENVKADDKPKGWHVDYINPARMTIPQTNFRLGYYITDKYNVSIGVDHMKYVMMQDKSVNYTGYYPNAGTYGEQLVPGQILLTEDFLSFEHTDGLNYVNAEINRVDDISKLFNIGDTDKIQVNFTEGVGLGLLYPKTNTKLLGKERYDEFHVAGFGISAKAGINITFLKYFFVQTELKGGFINMTNVRTTADKADRASHHFLFVENVIAFGGIFRI